jgi:hypothetical protein
MTRPRGPSTQECTPRPPCVAMSQAHVPETIDWDLFEEPEASVTRCEVAHKRTPDALPRSLSNAAANMQGRLTKPTQQRRHGPISGNEVDHVRNDAQEVIAQPSAHPATAVASDDQARVDVSKESKDLSPSPRGHQGPHSATAPIASGQVALAAQTDATPVLPPDVSAVPLNDTDDQDTTVFIKPLAEPYPPEHPGEGRTSELFAVRGQQLRQSYTEASGLTQPRHAYAANGYHRFTDSVGLSLSNNGAVTARVIEDIRSRPHEAYDHPTYGWVGNVWAVNVFRIIPEDEVGRHNILT